MRTKALLCAAAIVAAGVATSMAQSNVYSLNVVGYLQPSTGTNSVGIGLTNGFNLVANHLDATYPPTFVNNTLQSVFGTNLPVLTTVYGFDPVSGYKSVQYLGNLAWSGGANSNVVNAQLAPGKGVWVLLSGSNGRPTPIPLTLVGNVVEGTNTLPVVAGFQIMSIIPPISARLKTDMGMTPKALDIVYMWDAVKKSYDTRQFFGGTSWGGGEPSPGVGSAFWWKSGVATNWTQGFTVPRP